MDAGVEPMRKDVLMSFLYPFVRQATEEFPVALASIRTQLPVDDGPIGVLGGSLGGAVALRILADTDIPDLAGAVVNAGICMQSKKASTAWTSSPRPASSPVARRC